MLDTLFQDTPLVVLYGISAGVLSIIAFLPYIRDTLTGRTKPQRASWLIWSVLSVIALFSQVYEGAGPSLLFAGVQVSCTLLIFALSSWVGTRNRLRRTDHLIFLAAGFGLMLWYHTDSATYALAISISISLLGGAATVIKTYRDPGSETCVTWVLSFVASGFAILAVGSPDPVLLAYPVYLLVLYGAILAAVMLGRMRKIRQTRAAGSAQPLSHNLTAGQSNGPWVESGPFPQEIEAANTPEPVVVFHSARHQ